MTLRIRLAIAFGVVLLAMAALAVIVPHTVRSAQIEQVDRQLRRSLPVVERIGFDRASLPPPSPDAASRPADDSPNEVYVARVEEDGSRTELFVTLSAADRSPALPPAPAAAGEDPELHTVGSATGTGSWRAMLVVTSDGTEILIAAPLDAVERTAERIDTTLTVAGGAALLVVLAAGWWVFRLGLRPIDQVTKVAAAYASGDRGRRVPERGNRTEAAQLARTFNLMLDEQQAAEERLRRFVADASHELRTPVAAIGGFADLYRHDAVAAGELDDVMRRIGQESARMRGLVEDMLLLAHLDEHRPLAAAAVDLSRLAADAALDASASHPSRAVTVHAPTPVVVHGDEARLRQVVANLVANALVHTNRDVRITLGATTAGAVLTVADEGPGLDPAMAELAFERFWRADAARSGTGSGLGLPIVRGIVQAHGGTIDLVSDPVAGTTVTIFLPRRPDHGDERGPVQVVTSRQASK
jgi:two-component system OmpR family sensor kinase